jgi:hypothetical protein
MQIILDRTGFPLVYIKPIKAYIHALPLSKIQFERYISDPGYGVEDIVTYENILKENPRISPNEDIREKPWRLFTTGLLPAEMSRYKAWQGANFDFATNVDWEKSVNWLDTMKSNQVMQAMNNTQGINPLAKMIFKKIFTEFSPKSGTDLCMFFGAVMEWVTVNGRMMLIGKAASGLWNHIDARDRFTPLPPDERRRSYYSSFRLIKY